MFYVYILRTSKNTLYTGQTNNVEKRLAEHRQKSKKSAKYLKYFDSFELVYVEKLATRSLGLTREIEIKKLTKQQKELLISKSEK